MDKWDLARCCVDVEGELGGESSSDIFRPALKRGSVLGKETDQGNERLICDDPREEVQISDAITVPPQYTHVEGKLCAHEDELGMVSARTTTEISACRRAYPSRDVPKSHIYVCEVDVHPSHSISQPAHLAEIIGKGIWVSVGERVCNVISKCLGEGRGAEGRHLQRYAQDIARHPLLGGGMQRGLKGSARVVLMNRSRAHTSIHLALSHPLLLFTTPRHWDRLPIMVSAGRRAH